MIDPETVDWEHIAHILYKKLSNMDEVDNRPFPRAQKCVGCGGEFQQKRFDHKHCKESCRWKDCLRKNGLAAERARKRFRDWYSVHRAEHIANVTRRKAERKAASLSRPTRSQDTENEFTEGSRTSEPYEKSLKCASELTTSKITTGEFNTGEGQSQ